MRIIASLVCVSALVAPVFGKWGLTNFWNRVRIWSNDDAEWTCKYGGKSKGPFTYDQAVECIQEKLEKTKYNKYNVKLANSWLEIPYSIILDRTTRYQVEGHEHKADGYCIGALLGGVLADKRGEAIKNKVIQEWDFNGKLGAIGKVSIILSKLKSQQCHKLSHNMDSAASQGGAGARLQVLLNGCQKIQVSVQNYRDHESLNKFVLNEARKRFGKNVITKDATTAKYFFRGGDSINKFDTNRPCWTEACHKDSWNPQGLYWPGEYALQHFENIGRSETRADIAMYEFDQKRFQKEGGEIIEMDEKMLQNIISIDDINQISGGDGAIETLLAEPEKMGSRISTYMNIIRFKPRNYWVNRPLVIKRVNSQWDRNHTGKVDCHIFVNGAAKYLKKKLQVELTN